jgi:hypothetical protein
MGSLKLPLSAGPPESDASRAARDHRPELIACDMPGSTDEARIVVPIRCRLLPHLGVLVLLSGLVSLISDWLLRGTSAQETILLGFSIVAMLYVALLILRTRDLVADFAHLHPIDAFIARRAGPLAALLAGFLLFMAIVAPDWTLSRLGLEPLYYLLELDFVIAVTCLLTPRAIAPGVSGMVWKAVACVLAIITGMYVFCIPMARLVHISQVK